MRRVLKFRSARLPGATPEAGSTWHVLLGSVDATFLPTAIEDAARRAGPGGSVYVVSTARVYGTALGFPHPGLYPTRKERSAHMEAVAAAVHALEATGTQARGEVLATRHAARLLARRARQRGCREIVVSAGPRPRLGAFTWSGEPYRLARRASVPVEVIVTRGEDGKGGRGQAK